MATKFKDYRALELYMVICNNHLKFGISIEHKRINIELEYVLGFVDQREFRHLMEHYHSIFERGNQYLQLAMEGNGGDGFWDFPILRSAISEFGSEAELHFVTFIRHSRINFTHWRVTSPHSDFTISAYSKAIQSVISVKFAKDRALMSR